MNCHTQPPVDHLSPAPHRIRLSDGTEVITRTVEPQPAHDSLGDIVICHGAPCFSRMWMTLARELGRDHRVFLWDMLGYGESIAETAFPVDLITQGRRMAELVNVWSLETPHVIAHDIGGAVALGAHLLENCDFASLFLLDIVALSPWGPPFFRLVAENEPVFAALPPQLHCALVTEYIDSAGGQWLDRERVEELAAPWCTTAGQAAFYHQIASLRSDHTEPIVDCLGEVRCPVRIGWGTEDPWIPVEQARQLAQMLPGTTAVSRFPGAGHLVPLESPHEMSLDFTKWLNSKAPGTKS